MDGLIIWGVLMGILSVLVLAPCLINRSIFKKMLTFIIFFGYIYVVYFITIVFSLNFHPFQTVFLALVVAALYYGMVDNWLVKIKNYLKNRY